MTEEINNLNTDLKELFTNNKLDLLYQTLDQTQDPIIKEITVYNYDIIKKYYESQKYGLLIQYIRFVAYSCCLCEYAAEKQIIEAKVFEDMSLVFQAIYNEVLKRKA